MVKASIYKISLFGERLRKQSTQKGVERVIDEYLKNGAHPLYLEHGLYLVSDFLPGVNFEKVVGLIVESKRKFPAIKPSAGNLDEIYKRLSSEPAEIHPGVLHGSLLEAFGHFSDQIRSEKRQKGWQDEWHMMIQRFISHPSINMLLITNIVLLEHVMRQYTEDGKFKMYLMSHTKMLRDKINDLSEEGYEKLIEEFLVNYDPLTSYDDFVVFFSILGDCQPEEILESFLDVYESGRGVHKNAAIDFMDHIFDKKKWSDEQDWINFGSAVTMWIERLKSNLYTVETFHAMLRWMKVLPPAQREALIGLLAFKGSGEFLQTVGIESLLEPMIGSESWSALVDLANSIEYVTSTDAVPGFGYLGLIDATSPSYKKFREKLRDSNLSFKNHNCILARTLDQIIDTAEITEETAIDAWDHAVNLLAGDNIRTPSHLKPEGSSLIRRVEEFLGPEIPIIEVARHPVLGENGPACKFKLYFSDEPDIQATGLMDQEGDITLDHILALTQQGWLGVRAVVAESLAAMTVPNYIDHLPKKGGGGTGITFTGEVWASRPTIHTLGELSEEKKNKDDSLGTRINPVIAEWIFKWLLNQDSSREWQFYRKVEEDIEGTKEYYFVNLSRAKELLRLKKVALREVYTHTVRAHTKPVGVRLVDNKVVPDHVSEHALRNYERFVRDTGRELDMTSTVRKTFRIKETGLLVVQDLKRTFNQGAYNDLFEVWQMLLNSNLKVLAKDKFLL